MRGQLLFLEEELTQQAHDALSNGESEEEVGSAIQNHLIQWLVMNGTEVSLSEISNEIFRKSKLP